MFGSFGLTPHSSHSSPISPFMTRFESLRKKEKEKEKEKERKKHCLCEPRIYIS
jgi:hypothetical protein